MAYESETGIEGRTGRTITTSTKPTTAQVAIWLDEESEDLDAAFKAAGYSVPIVQATSPKSYKIATKMVSLMVSVHVDRAAHITVKGKTDEPDRAVRWEKMYRLMLRQYCGIDESGKNVGISKQLPDATINADSSRMPHSYGLSISDDDHEDLLTFNEQMEH